MIESQFVNWSEEDNFIFIYQLSFIFFHSTAYIRTSYGKMKARISGGGID